MEGALHDTAKKMKQRSKWGTREHPKSSVMRVGSDTFGYPIFQKGLQI